MNTCIYILNLGHTAILVRSKGVVKVSVYSLDGCVVAVDMYAVDGFGVVHEVECSHIVDTTRVVLVFVCE